jgi:hypothetical protein
MNVSDVVASPRRLIHSPGLVQGSNVGSQRMQNILQHVRELPCLEHWSIMFSDRQQPHVVVLLFFVGFLVEVLLIILFVVVIFIIVTRVVRVVAFESRGLDCLSVF